MAALQGTIGSCLRAGGTPCAALQSEESSIANQRCPTPGASAALPPAHALQGSCSLLLRSQQGLSNVGGKSEVKMGAVLGHTAASGEGVEGGVQRSQATQQGTAKSLEHALKVDEWVRKREE